MQCINSNCLLGSASGTFHLHPPNVRQRLGSVIIVQLLPVNQLINGCCAVVQSMFFAKFNLHYICLYAFASLTFIGKTVPLWKVKLKQKKLKGQTMQPRHKGTLLLCDIRLHTGTLTAALTIVGRRDSQSQYMQSG